MWEPALADWHAPDKDRRVPRQGSVSPCACSSLLRVVLLRVQLSPRARAKATPAEGTGHVGASARGLAGAP